MLENPPAVIQSGGNPGTFFLRQFGSVPQVTGPANVPLIGAVTGLGNGGGAQIRTQPNGTQGTVEALAGSNPAAAGSLTLTFPTPPAALFVAADQEFGTVTPSLVSNVLTISWTGAAFVPGKRHKISYQPATSR